MPKRVAIIDLGSNSIRLSIFERTSRLGFFLFSTHKAKLRIGSGTYTSSKEIDKSLIDECVDIFSDFKLIIKKYKVKKTICIATSALRDAKNSKKIIKLIFKKFGISIKCIDGKFESELGALSAINLLDISDGITLDIGGGSTELSLIKDCEIKNSISLNVGTIRLKELFFDNNHLDFEEKKQQAQNFIDSVLNEIPKEFYGENLIVIGGSLRAISNAIMIKSLYPLKQTHGFEYNYETYRNLILNIIDTTELNKLNIKKDRFDTIKQGAMIFDTIVQKLGSKHIITSSAGIREGVFLKSILKNSNRFPKGFNPSIKSLQDRFLSSKKISKFTNQIFDALSSVHKLDVKYKRILSICAKLSLIGKGINDNKNNVYSMILNGLDYGITHKDKVLIACVIALNGKKEMNFEFDEFKYMLPSNDVVIWLSYILSVAKILDIYGSDKVQIKLGDDNKLEIFDHHSRLLKDSIKKLSKETILHHYN